MLRILIYGLVIYLAYRLLRKFSPSFPGGEREDQENCGTNGDTELIQDPECGTYFMKQRGVKAHIAGNTVYFCSDACRTRFVSKRQKH